MATIRLKGYITETGEIKVDLPKNHPVGEVNLTIEAPREDEKTEQETDSDDDVLQFKGQTLGEILESGLVGAWSDWDIGDSEEWVQEQRRKRREERQARWTDS